MLVSGILKRNKGEFRCVAVGNKIKKGVLLFTWIKIKFHCRGDNKASSHKKISATGGVPMTRGTCHIPIEG